MTEKYKKLTLAPFYNLVPSIDQMLVFSIILILPQIIMLFVTNSVSSLILLGTVVIASFIADILNTLFSHRVFKFSWDSLFQGIVIAFFIPSGYPAVLAFCVTLLALLIDKYAFGGFAQAWANPAVVTIIVMYFLGAKYFPSYLLSPDFLQIPNAGSDLFSHGLMHSGFYDIEVSSVLNNTVLSKLGISIPTGYVTLFWDTGSVIPACRFNFLTLISSLFLITNNIIEGIIPAVFLVVYSLLVALLGLFPYGGLLGGGDILLALLTSGTLFATFFVFTWFGTYPQSFLGKFAYGGLAGVGAFLIAGCGTSPIGIIFTVLIANVTSPFIQNIERSMYVWRTKKRLENDSQRCFK
jgi:electron transport complex protein RnfD